MQETKIIIFLFSGGGKTNECAAPVKVQVLEMHKYQIMSAHKTCRDFVPGHEIFFRDYSAPICSIKFSTRCEWRHIDWINMYLGK